MIALVNALVIANALVIVNVQVKASLQQRGVVVTKLGTARSNLHCSTGVDNRGIRSNQEHTAEFDNRDNRFLPLLCWLPG